MPASFPKASKIRSSIPGVRPGLAALCVLLLLGASLGSRPSGADRCLLTVRLVDAETGADAPGLIRLVDADERLIELPELLSRGEGLEGDLPIHHWRVVPGNQGVRISVPQEKLTLTAISGLETEQAQVTLDLTGQPERQIAVPLRRFSQTAERGWRSANTHLHLMKLTREQSDRYLSETPRADRLDLLFVSYLERAGADQDYITNRYRAADLQGLAERSGVGLGNGEEHRHNFGPQEEGYGHVMLLNLQQLVQPVSIGPGITKQGTDGLPVQRGIDAARRQGATAVWCHNNWGLEHIPNWVTGRLDAQNIFDGGSHGSYQDSFYRLLSAGFRVPFSTGTDWFLYDFSRVYVPVEGPLTTAAWLKSLAAGRSFITNGPLLEFHVGKLTSGDTLRLANRTQIEIAAKGTGRADFGRLELIRNGQVVETTASRAVEGHFESAARWQIGIDSPCWLAIRTPPPVSQDTPGAADFPRNELGQMLFSHASPIYVEYAGQPPFDPAAAQELLEQIERSLAAIEQKGAFANQSERSTVLQVYQEAHQRLKTKIEQSRRP
ncbi:MAG: CehA/McbA family metallohydrolase [Planctomycetales bacterium]